MLILGARGSGKSFHGRRLAEKHGLFHIAFKERLQEIIIAKTKHRIGPDIDTEAEEEEEDVYVFIIFIYYVLIYCVVEKFKM